jgi:hypothetical protein
MTSTMRHLTPRAALAVFAVVAGLAASSAPAQAPATPPTPTPTPTPLPAPLPAPAQGTVPQSEPTRGRLLYETHCIACHNTQMHWRDARIVRDWPGLAAQVRGWQARAKLEWSDADILEVSRHLNSTIYRLPQPGPA